MPRRGRGQERRPSRPNWPAGSRFHYSNPDAERACIDRYGSDLAELRGQLFLWAFVVAEAHAQALVHERAILKRLHERADHEDEFWFEAGRANKYRAAAGAWLPPKCEIAIPTGAASTDPNCLIVSFTRQIDPWPSEPLVVRFGLCSRGHVRTQCKGFPSDAMRLPEYARQPSDVNDAQAAAIELVRHALTLIAKHDPVLVVLA